MSISNIEMLKPTQFVSTKERAFENPDDEDHNDTNAEPAEGLMLGSVLRTWTQISKINYFSSQPLDIIKSGQTIRRKSIGVPPKDCCCIHDLVSKDQQIKPQEEVFNEQFPANVTNLMNDNQLWGSFYVFPELYADVYSPTVQILDEDKITENDSGILTRDLVACRLSYLARTPILKDFVYIKLNLTRKDLQDIDVLRHYKYIVYLDLSDNDIADLTVLSFLPYLQYLSVSGNKLENVLEYEPAQWFLTEVHYKFNMVKKIRDLSAFWSITILDLSHNNIKRINGLDKLMFLRRLDLSYNHIQRLENLNNLKLLWLDLSYNNISGFEQGPEVGLRTLLHLDYLNVNENNISSLKLFAGCSRFRELHARNNRFSPLLDMVVYMKRMRRLTVLDLRTDPICSSPNYKHVVFNTFPAILNVDGEDVDAQTQREYIMDMSPSPSTMSFRRLMRLLYIEQLTRARVSPFTPPADTNGSPLVVIVGSEAVGKEALVHRLTTECSEHTEQAMLHTTAEHHNSGRYLQVTRSHFDEMLLAGQFLTYSEIRGHSYGLSREEAYVRKGKIRVTSMDLTGALMLRDRGLRPYILLATVTDRIALARHQRERKETQHLKQESISTRNTRQLSSLHNLLCADAKAILKELLASATKEASKTVLKTDSLTETSLRRLDDRRASENLTKQKSSEATVNQRKWSKNSNAQNEDFTKDSPLLLSYLVAATESVKSIASTSPDVSETVDKVSQPDPKELLIRSITGEEGPCAEPGADWSAPFVSKSVTFPPAGAAGAGDEAGGSSQPDVAGMLIEPLPDDDYERNALMTMSSNLIGYDRDNADSGDDDYSDVWITFLKDYRHHLTSDVTSNTTLTSRATITDDDTTLLMKQLHFYEKEMAELHTKNLYEEINRRYPGLFWDTITMDDPNAAFIKAKRIIKHIAKTQPSRKPIFCTNFSDSKHYPAIQTRLERIQKRIAPHRLFY